MLEIWCLLVDCRESDCVPDIPFFYGRNDCGVSQFFTHTFCPIHGDATAFFRDEFGLNKEEYTTLMGEGSFLIINH